MRLFFTFVLLLVSSLSAQMRLGVNVLDVNDWSGPYFSDLLHHARSRSPHAQKPLWSVEGQSAHALVGVRPELTDVRLDGLINGAFGVQNVRIAQITGPNPSVRVAPGFFHPAFLEALQPWTGYVRLMDWGGVFSERRADLPASSPPSANGHTDTTGGTWSENLGAPWFYAAELSKLFDVWVCIPSLATTDDARAMGQYFGRVAKKRVAVEFSNELWNGAFPQNRLIRVGANWDDYLMTALRLAQERVAAFELGFRSTGNTQPLCKVFAWQLGDDAGPLWNFRRETWGNQNLVNPAARDALRQFNALAIAPYFGHKDGSADPVADVRALERPLQLAKEITTDLSLLLLGYEGGQHYVGPNSVALQRSPKMGDAMREYLVLCNRFLDELVLYALVGPANPQWGSWGLMERWGDNDAPKVSAVRSWLTQGNGGGTDTLTLLKNQLTQVQAELTQVRTELTQLKSALREALR